ncbi:hypothetical protein DCBHLPFO_00665 [Mycoplasmopsis arginini]|uniref:Uncharacterized protein n=1 Tax=Mycoplasmopsis arginini TaxID=2094 RepID=A0AA43QXC7_MYCAR|nr:hypothetical protein [Mycoplasmopsis arginini]
MNQYFGWKWFITSMVFLTSSIPKRAVSVLGMYAPLPPVQWWPNAATLNPVQGGDAQITSGWKGTLVTSKSKILTA